MKHTRIRLQDDLVCFSHLRWNFVFQRPQHLMSRAARDRRVYFVEEPIFDAESPTLAVTPSDGVQVVVPHLPAGTPPLEAVRLQRTLLTKFAAAVRIADPWVWLYTPMALPLVDAVRPSMLIYDCMDELSGFALAAPELVERERELLSRAAVVFTGGHSLYEAKRGLHPNVHPFPSSVDVPHFAQARDGRPDPDDQRALARPRIGFAGVIDERMNIDLVGELARRQPGWQFIMIGPVVKIDPATLPQSENLHYLGMKAYADLPAYLGGWDVAILPFAHNSATRYISPTKTPEYLAAGCPVVSTSIRDVVRPYGERGFVSIADSAIGFEREIARALSPAGAEAVRRARSYVSTMSWDATWASMREAIRAASRTAVPVRAHADVRPTAPGAAASL